MKAYRYSLSSLQCRFSRIPRLITAIALGVLLGVLVGGGRPVLAQIDLRWPTPNPAWENGEWMGGFLQHAGSGNPLSGGYGSVRNGGTRFHEGIDLFAVRRDAHGEPLDEVFAAMSGVVRYVNAEPKHSSYGRYIVLEHDGEAPAIYTLYAHLASVDLALLPDKGESPRVSAGQVLGRMGRSAGGYVIPKARAHLHFEMGLRLTDDFEWWYQARGFDDPNYHGAYNGMNLMGFDPLAFYEAHRAGRIRTIADWLTQMKPAVVLHVATEATPDFVRRYPSVVREAEGSIGTHAGWRIECDRSGIPFRWTPLGVGELSNLNPGEVSVVAIDEALISAQPAKRLVINSPMGLRFIGPDLEVVCQLLFGKQD